MARVHRHRGKPYYFGYFYDQDGVRRCWSTKTANKKQAEEICARWEQAARAAKMGRLSPERCRTIIEEGVAAIAERAGVVIQRQSIESFFLGWIASKVGSDTTLERYEGIVRQFLKHLGARSKQSLLSLSSDDVQAYRDSIRASVSSGTVNTHLKVIRACLEHAKKRKVISSNPAEHVENLSRSDKFKRRAFTLPELRKLLSTASDEWRTMILVSLYGGGIRLSDVASLTWENVDLVRKELTYTMGKTDRTQILPLALPLVRHLENLPAGDDPKAPLCPRLYGESASRLSNQFYELMVGVGLVAPRSKETTDEKRKGRSARRQLNEISFHALRHTATSLLKNAGVSDAIARDLVGHSSEIVSRNYTHIESETKRLALDRLPDLSAPPERQLGLGL